MAQIFGPKTLGALVPGSVWKSGAEEANKRSGKVVASPLDGGWLFGGKLIDGDALSRQFDERGFSKITLPRCVTKLRWQDWDPSKWEDRWIYRRHFSMPGAFKNRRVFVDFDGVMAGASPVFPGKGKSAFSAILTKSMLSEGTAQVETGLAADSALPARARKRVTGRLIPYLMFIYFLAYLDRANLGVAKLQMQGALGFNDAVIGLGAGIFFLGYLLLDIPGSLIVERWSARKWIAGIMISWGIVATLMGFTGMPVFHFTSSLTQFYSLRLLLGITEAGFFPGVIIYLSHWYRAEDRARAKAYFMLTQPLAIAIGVPVSRWILENVGWAGLGGWRWVFILEGIPPVLMGVVTLWYLTDRPRDARWLPKDEKRWLVEELHLEEAGKIVTGRVSAGAALRRRQTYFLIAVYFLIVTGNQALIFFLPSITDALKSMPVSIRTLGASAPYACSALGILLNGMWAHRTGALRWHTSVPMLATGVSLGLAVLASGNAWLMMALFCLAGFTSQAYLPAFWTLPTVLLGRTAAATAVGLICLGNLGGFAGPWLFGYLKTVTGRYDTGLWVLAGCMLLAGALAAWTAVARVAHPTPRNEEKT